MRTNSTLMKLWSFTKTVLLAAVNFPSILSNLSTQIPESKCSFIVISHFAIQLTKIAQFVKAVQLQENDDLLRAILQEQLAQ